MKRRILTLVLTLLLVFSITTHAAAQNYSFVLSNEVVHVYWNSDGTVSLDYLLTFQNDIGAHVIDFIDLGLPNGNYDFNSITADVGGNSLSISSDFQGDGPDGVAIDMGSYAIQPGQSGSVHVVVGSITNMFFPDTADQNLTSGEFAPAYWTTAHGNTNLMITFHLPVGVKPEEPRYHTPAGSWPGDAAPTATIDDQGRINYTWQSTLANGYTQYTFGLSVPRSYIPAGAIYKPSIWETIGISFDTLFTWGICGCFILLFFGLPILGVINERKRKMKYLPPKISIEGHGIKRGLTAVEAAILMEQSLDKVMTMILFGVIKKGAATVVTRDPLKLTLIQPQPEGLNEYEKDFLLAFSDPKILPKKGLQEMTVKMIKAVGDKMKGFSGKESIVYYKSIMERAWQQIESAETPEVKSDMYEESLEWTMLDKNYDERTRQTFTGPIFVPMWWGHYDPTYSSSSSLPKATGGVQIPSFPSGRSTTSVPGSAFAASVITGVQNFSSKVIGDVNTFTSGVTKTTNPVPKSSGSFKSGGGGGHSCACACAGCACACAGGGR
ncbi:MAG: hypothetical protein A2X25_11665 [Chloroflexi bacterium GWB2_49_20]|nr:MAG: hypothetical protein A2X25_11665 [Chloroflexi bacterium GWB2_49_20]OGN77666.1 MAG: hypothetical protein A2X26_09935 [Chloroflexi bacterium GWC2_49_37]OGN86442.1 MAG: hypothetical protein A2X27_06090 [Chloroflexi bacterium GWD2_49_16]HBG74682.1 hypothetical protein [Anaerolineae bacterium]